MTGIVMEVTQIKCVILHLPGICRQICRRFSNAFFGARLSRHAKWVEDDAAPPRTVFDRVGDKRDA
jgi:hypothetical protein